MAKWLGLAAAATACGLATAAGADADQGVAWAVIVAGSSGYGKCVRGTHSVIAGQLDGDSAVRGRVRVAAAWRLSRQAFRN